uniref:Zaragozic acid A biosynthesis cluster protein 1 n=1 Tax=Cochliobolus lunatus TaxID=5503 RepID=CLZ1_COCLU|nr:RecName: Full=Zaragozic acid A biosynthesis cluster protein 1; AltName: Full=Squalestatin S1 biosynthesis cluster protein clz1 [Curvularia lunata]AXF50652.1 Clz1 [Curvularia lunata]
MRSPWADDVEYQKDPLFLNYEKRIWDNSTNQTTFSWHKDTREIASSSILALALVHDVWGPVIAACSIDARWAASDIYVIPTNSTVVFSNTTDSLMESLRHSNQGNREANIAKYGLSRNPIDIQLEWAEKLNRKYIFDLSVKPSQRMKAAPNEEINAIETFLMDIIPSMRVDPSVSTLLGLIVSDSISRTINTTRAPWGMVEEVDSNGSWNYSEVVRNSGNENRPNPDDDNGYVMRVIADRYGYGFALRVRFGVLYLESLPNGLVPIGDIFVLVWDLN